MDSTFVMNGPEMDCSVDEDLLEFFTCQQQPICQREEAKTRLSQFRERSKKMLKKHDWQRFFPAQPVEARKASVFERHLLGAENEPIVTGDEASFVSTIEYSFLMLDAEQQVKRSELQKPAVCVKMSPFKALKRNTDTMETPTLARKTTRIEYNNSDVKKPKLTRQQSLTFIADLASTSTPTRATKQPITSTPTKLSHNPRKYHPAKTIRNKRKDNPKQPKQSTVVKISSRNLSLSNQITRLKENNKYLIAQAQRDSSCKAQRLISILSGCSSCRQCQSHNFVTATSYNFINVEHSTPSAQRRGELRMARPASTRARNRTKTVRVEELHRILRQRREAQSANKCANAVGIKPAKKQKIEISLEDLLYTPSRLVRSDSFGAKVVQCSTRISSKTAAPADKVYFL